MIECIIDTHILADILMQYSAVQPNLSLVESDFLTRKILSKINPCIESNGYSGVVVASAFAFVEMVNRFEDVSKGKFKLAKLIELLNQPPDWFIIEPYTEKTVFYLISVPKRNLKGETVALEDAIHVATAMQRGPESFFATHDGILGKLNFENLNIKFLL